MYSACLLSDILYKVFVFVLLYVCDKLKNREYLPDPWKANLTHKQQTVLPSTSFICANQTLEEQ